MTEVVIDSVVQSNAEEQFLFVRKLKVGSVIFNTDHLLRDLHPDRRQ